MVAPRLSTDDLMCQLDARPADRPLIVDARLAYAYEHCAVTLPAPRLAAPVGSLKG
jgi:hypothetical protein